MTVRNFLTVLLFSLGVLTPTITSAFPFGGQITLYHVCFNETLFARLSPPVPGDYVWTTATRTYQFGPPRSAGQWLLGLTGIPFDCLWSVNPIFPVPAIAIMMMGSSQASFRGVSSGSYSNDPTLQPKSLPSEGGQCNGGTIPFKAGVGTQLKPDIKRSLEGFCATATSIDWQVTEGCPNTTVHSNACHSKCTCVDIGFKSRVYTAETVQAAIKAGSQNGANLVFETNDSALHRSLLSAGLSDAQVKLYPQVTGSHFSYYCPSCSE